MVNTNHQKQRAKTSKRITDQGLARRKKKRKKKTKSSESREIYDAIIETRSKTDTKIPKNGKIQRKSMGKRGSGVDRGEGELKLFWSGV